MTDTINVPRELLERALYLMDNYIGTQHPEEDELRALLQAPAQPAQVQGWQMVPVDPTEEMLKGPRSEGYSFAARLLYKAMLAAAPKPPVESFCYCDDEISLQMVSGGGAEEGLFGRITLKIDGEYVSYLREAPKPPVQEPVRQVIPCKTCGNGGSLEGDKECPVCWGVGYLGIAAPQPSDAKDAARWRHYRQGFNDPETVEASVDRAMAENRDWWQEVDND